jgi:hypothetical protein
MSLRTFFSQQNQCAMLTKTHCILSFCNISNYDIFKNGFWTIGNIPILNEELNTERPRLQSSLWVPRNLSNHMDRQARTRDTVLHKSIER